VAGVAVRVAFQVILVLGLRVPLGRLLGCCRWQRIENMGP
jgi:hypothetical protein